MEENEKILKAKEVLDRLNEDEEEREMAYRRQRAIMDQDAIREAGYDEGFEEGKEKGKIDVARKMIDNNMSIDLIIEITGLTREQIENIK